MKPVHALLFGPTWRRIKTDPSRRKRVLDFLLNVLLLLSPWLHVRFGVFWAERIGHLAIETELYLCQKKNDPDSFKRVKDIMHYAPPYSNTVLADKYRKITGDCPFSMDVWQHFRHIPKAAPYIAAWRGRELYDSRDVDDYLPRTPAFARLSQKESRNAARRLEELGVPSDATLVCFHNRDSAYLKKAFPDIDYSYHDYRDTSVGRMVPAMNWITDQGMHAIRMGQNVAEPLPISHPQMFDYGNGHYDALLDLHIIERCRFFVGTTSGLIVLASVLRRPAVYTNHIPIGVVETHRATNLVPDLFIPKKMRDRKTGRLLSVQEIRDIGVSRSVLGHEYEAAGVDPVENSEQEIQGAVMEMEARLNGTWTTTPEAEALQMLFWETLWPGQPLQTNTRIATDFLKRNPGFLGLSQHRYAATPWDRDD